VDSTNRFWFLYFRQTIVWSGLTQNCLHTFVELKVKSLLVDGVKWFKISLKDEKKAFNLMPKSCTICAICSLKNGEFHQHGEGKEEEAEASSSSSIR
jgi:hypothetical protein